MPALAREAAFHAIRMVSSGDVDLGEALARTRDRVTDPRDRALATDLVTGTFRWRGALDYQLALRSGRPLTKLDPDVLDALRLGAYQLLYLERVPASAAVNDSVAIVKAVRLTSAAPFVNAVLRRLARERGELTWPEKPAESHTAGGRQALLAYLSVVASHPAWLVARWIERYGPERAEAWLNFNNQHATLTLATNRLLGDRAELVERLAGEGITTAPTLVAPHGLRVLDGRPLTSHAFREGFCFVQDEASQLIPELVAARAGDLVLDGCAAPGGKTLALAAQAGSEGMVVACDVRARRIRVLATTIGRCRAATQARLVHISERDPFPFQDARFDAVLIDAPCSGLGTVRRDPDIKWRRVPSDLPRFAKTQVDLLQRAARVVAPGRRLVYSTCSSEPEENEEVVAVFLAAAPDFAVRRLSTLPQLPSPIRALETPDGYLRTDPARDGLEAFFGAVLERR